MAYKEIPEITDKQKEIIKLVFQFRFINRKQIQTYMRHKDPKRINAWLKDLVYKKFLGRIYSHKLLENTKPAIYYLDNFGILLGKYQFYDDDPLPDESVKKLYDDKNASRSFIDKCVLIFDVYLDFYDPKNINEYGYDTFASYYTKNDNWISHRDYKDFTDKKRYIPDLKLKVHDNGEETNYHFEYFESYAPKYAIEYKGETVF